MFHAEHHPFAWFAAVAQVEHEARVGGGETPELGGGKAGLAQEPFYLADQHGGTNSGDSRGGGIILWSLIKSYLSRKNLSYKISFMDSSDPRARLMALVAAQGVSLAGLSALLGRNASYLQQFVRKGSPRKLEENDRRTLARFFGVDEAELGGGGDTGPAAYAGQRRGAAEWIDVPRLGLGASAGPGALAGTEVAVGQLRFAAAWLKRHGLTPAMLSAIEVEGDSMEPALRDGDEILVDRTPRALRSGIHVVRLDDVLLVKRIERLGAERLRLLSDNPAYAPVDRALGEVEVIGHVVWKGGKL